MVWPYEVQDVLNGFVVSALLSIDNTVEVDLNVLTLAYAVSLMSRQR